MSEPDDKFSAWREELEHQAQFNPVLASMIRRGRPLTADVYIQLNWWGEEPGEIEGDEQEVIDLLNSRPTPSGDA